VLEKYALRVQKSVFLFRGSTPAVEALLDLAAQRMDLKFDAIQAWQLSSGQTAQGRLRGTPLNVCPAGIVLDSGTTLLVRFGPGPVEATPSGPESEPGNAQAQENRSCPH
jgi:hypothetical protein